MMMMNTRLIAATLLLASNSCSSAMDFATKGAHMLEESFIQDCQENQEPHGYYGAFFQPCEFSFYQATTTDQRNRNACSDDSTSTLLEKPTPMHWFFNLTDHIDKDDWDSMDSWDSQDWQDITDKLFLWPDQCVGVQSRCYFVEDVLDNLTPLFHEHTIPADATHVQVNCQADAMMLSRTVYAFADGFEKSMPTLIAWMVTVVLVSVVMLSWCVYGCARLWCGNPKRKTKYYSYRPIHQEHNDAEIVKAEPV